MAKKGFIKYEYEDIRTEFKATDVAPSSDILAGTVIEVSEEGVAESDSAVNNTSIFLLAEDFKTTDKGFVYYIVEDNSNLEDRA